MPEKTIICIHCKQRRLPSIEHSVGRSLGGNQTAPLLCTPCNNRGSKLDQVLAESSLVALSRVTDTPPDAFRTKIGFDVFLEDESIRLTFEYTIRNGFQPEPYPQVHVCPSLEDPSTLEFGVCAKDARDLRRLDSFITSALSEGRLRGIHVKEGPPVAGDTPRLVLHRSNDAFVRVPAGKPDEAETLFVHLEKEWQGNVDAQLAETGLPSKVVENRRIRISMSLCLNDIYRAVAKIAFNVMAIRLGVEFALRDEFDAIRDYIVGKDIRNPEVLQENQIAVDSRFVSQQEEFSTPYLATKGHTVLLIASGGFLYAQVTLYGMHEYLVRLGPATPNDFFLSVTEYSITRDGYRQLEVDEILERVTEARRLEAERLARRSA